MKNALLAVLLVAPCLLEAQSAPWQPTVILPGRRIRVETARTFTAGSLSAETADSLIIIDKHAARIALPTREIMGVQMSEGKSHGLGALKGMGYGAAILGGGFALLGGMSGYPEAALIYGVAGGMTGAIYGTVIGAIAGAEKWSAPHAHVPRVTVGAAPSGATRVGLSISF
jgi:hypothetical protein